MTRPARSQTGPTRVVRVPRCRAMLGTRRCGRPVDHDPRCALSPLPEDRVRDVGHHHVLVDAGPRDVAVLVVAAEPGVEGGDLRVRRDRGGRGLWFSAAARSPSAAGRSRPVLIGWDQVRRLATDLGLELSEPRGPAAAPSSAPGWASERAGRSPPPRRSAEAQLRADRARSSS